MAVFWKDQFSRIKSNFLAQVFHQIQLGRRELVKDFTLLQEIDNIVQLMDPLEKCSTPIGEVQRFNIKGRFESANRVGLPVLHLPTNPNAGGAPLPFRFLQQAR